MKKGKETSSAYANFSIVILYTGEMNRDGAMCRYVKTLSIKEDVDKISHVFDKLSYLGGVDRYTVRSGFLRQEKFSLNLQLMH